MPVMNLIMDVDWREVVDLELRGTQRADMSHRFSHFATGALADMVRRALARDDQERQKVVFASPRLGASTFSKLSHLLRGQTFPGI